VAFSFVRVLLRNTLHILLVPSHDFVAEKVTTCVARSVIMMITTVMAIAKNSVNIKAIAVTRTTAGARFILE
jgi:hypothetical protein